jgi:4-hydroxy-2-oxoheptanedioate aldolase
LYPGDNFNVTTSNRHICLIPQIESVKGIENAEEIAAVDGLAAMMFGPGDFMIDAGLPLKLGGEPHPKFLEAMTKFGAAAAKNNLPILAYATRSSLRSVLGPNLTVLVLRKHPT